MTPEAHIEHFLVVYDVTRRAPTEIRPFGSDYERAVEDYATLEESFSGLDDVEVVLLSADSLETIKRTHSSYFAGDLLTLDALLDDVLVAPR